MILRHFVCLSLESAAIVFAALGWYAVATWPRAPLAWILAAALSFGALGWGWFVLAQMALDVDRQRAENDRAWGEAERVWVDLDGDGEVDPGEEFDLHDYRQDDPAAKEARRQRLRALLQWIYERQREYPRLSPGDCYGQSPGRAAFGRAYDDLANELARRGFLVGHSTGHTGRPALSDQAAALVAFDGQEE